MSFQICMTLFLLRNTKEDILNNVDKKNISVSVNNLGKKIKNLKQIKKRKKTIGFPILGLYKFYCRHVVKQDVENTLNAEWINK